MHVLPSLAVAICACLCYALPRFWGARHDPREPPSLPQRIPVIGHVIGMIQKKGRYYIQLRRQYGAPIYSLAMPEGSKLYIVTSTELISAVQRQPKTLAFPPIGVKFALSLADPSREAREIATKNINGDEGDWGLSMDFNKAVYPALSPGAPLEAMNRIVIPSIAISLDKLQAKSGDITTIGLNQWVRHELTLAITDSVYGPQNPFKDRATEDAFWDFENDLFRIMLNVLPPLVARKGCRGRQLLSDAFSDYFRGGGLKNASLFAQARFASSSEHKLALGDIARLEVVTLIGTLTSTIRTVTWMLYHIFSDPAVLNDCRKEVSEIMATSHTAQGALMRSLDLATLKRNCPILGSTFQEVLRRHAVGTSVRQVMRDTLLEERYLLKEGSVVLMPSVVVHSDASVWGPDVSAFNHRRFLKPTTSAGANNSSTSKVPNPSAFRAFGGGKTLCPGRHFATTITMATVAMFLIRYEMMPLKGRWPQMTADNTHAVAAVEQPDYEIEAEVKVRSGFEDGEWAFRLDNSDVVFATAAEDLV